MKSVLQKTFLHLLIPIVSIGIISCGDDQSQMNTNKESFESPPSINEEEKTSANKILLTQKQVDELKIKTVSVNLEQTSLNIYAPAFVYPAPENYAVVSAPLDGRIVEIYAHEGEKVKKGEIIAEIESIQYGNIIAEYLQAKAEENYQKNTKERISSLVEKKISTKSELDKVEAEYSRAKSAVNAAYSKLKAVGTGSELISQLEFQTSIDTKLKIYSPINGIIDQHLIDLGESVNAYDKLATIINTQKVLIRGFVSPEDGTSLKAGDKIQITLNENRSKNINGEIASINPALDENNKSIVVNVILSTKDGWPKPGSNVRMEIESETVREIVTLPMSAVAYENENPIVFVKISESEFEKRVIEIESINNESVVVKDGLKENELIAINQIFSLKALYRFEEFAEE
ncbi:MAG: efflux RND transporter periplasmic adaptor subunit [Melioribacteraceae bacterium]|nr:efflux RND transporter periplasmic adaptor subunit [Melioribacteraceae bacterium]MCF8263706.1 efflux RND transporter periplasmic adaptor subunit [Melioribacteraceae bacterium]MCF8432284.1 efflux RND transporter periplasmic adaptor subunit [Melioribacteraceae bacterium]